MPTLAPDTESEMGFNLNAVGYWVSFDVSNYSIAAVQAGMLSGAWSSAIVSIQRSADGVTYGDFSTAVTLSSSGQITGNIDVSGYSRLRAIVTTANGAALLGVLTCTKKRTNTTPDDGKISP